MPPNANDLIELIEKIQDLLREYRNFLIEKDDPQDRPFIEAIASHLSSLTQLQLRIDADSFNARAAEFAGPVSELEGISEALNEAREDLNKVAEFIQKAARAIGVLEGIIGHLA